MKRALSLCFLLLLAMAAWAQGKDSGIVYGPDWAYLIVAPTGFKMDDRALRKEGIWGLFYKAEQERYLGDALNMYIVPYPKGGDYPSDLDSLIAWDRDFFEKGNPGLRIARYKDAELGDFNACRLYALDDAGRGYYMLHGYAMEDKASFVFVLVARSAEERAANEAAYLELLKSFVYMNKE